ncbi:uncharacterized protein LOC112500567 isoform X1 [Cynara cardunculus var. scolymus]|nr:uncharacterized protein LOC112500567 isoform X1 [Cynara cardunculus var. scolymus]XP_024959849.1 uncharacterized protein LOC112500567 isoform X1 [Cynara cardunculus var. scolymus]
MSPSRSKSKDKRAAGKELLKSSAKSAIIANTGGGIPASGYNPLLGTFHTLETAPVSGVPPVHVNGRFRDIDDADDPSGNSVGIGVEYDCVSNNGSWSGESEDPKDKAFQGPFRHEAIHGVDSDKREKIRQKNEKKHQRQKERRAQELHERCCGYLMSRKLEALAQQLVAMGFSSERATMALILNEGRVEESVAWLFEGGDDAGNQREHNNLDGGGNLKVDISQELAQIVDMEVKFKCSKQEVERAIVACEGDLDQAAENLIKLQKQEAHPGPLKTEGTGDPPTECGSGKPSVAVSQISLTSKVQSKRTSVLPIQQKLDHKDIQLNQGAKNIQLLKKVQPNSDWAKQQQQAAVAAPSIEKRWVVGGLNPSVSYSLASPLHAAPPPSKTESQYATSVGNEFKNLQLGSVREPIIMMQRPQSKHIPTTSMSSVSSSVGDWNSNGVVEPMMGMNPNGFTHLPTTTRSFSTPSYGSSMSNQLYDQFHYHQQPLLPQQQYAASSGGMLDHRSSQPVPTNHNGMWNRMVGPTPTLAAASSLGLFSGNGGGAGTSQVDWNGDWSSQFDYTNIDWSLNRLPSPVRGSWLRPNGMWLGGDVSATGRSAVRPTIVGNGNDASGGGSREWTSPFEEKDLFSLPRQFVSSPSL